MRSVVAVVLLLSGIVGGAIFAYGLLTTEASHLTPTLTPTPSIRTDIQVGPSFNPIALGNIYNEDPDSNSDAGDQLMTIGGAGTGSINACSSRTVTDFTQIVQRRFAVDFVFQNADEMVGADIRLNYDPSKLQLASPQLFTPFPGSYSGQNVGLINLPAPPYFGFSFSAHPTASPAINVDNTNGAAVLGGSYLGNRTAGTSSESGPTVDSGVSASPAATPATPPAAAYTTGRSGMLWTSRPPASAPRTPTTL